MIKGNRAFSLTELMIVLVIIAMLFCAMAPIITKRHIAETHENESIWNFVSGDSDRNAFFDPGIPGWSSSVYIGNQPLQRNPDAGKLVIDTGSVSYDEKSYISPHMQFRFSKSPQEQGRGIDAATLLFNKNNTILFGSYPFFDNGTNSTVYGISNLTSHQGVYSSSVMGSGAMEKSKLHSDSGPKQSIISAFGHRAAYKFGNGQPTEPVTGIFIGSNAGSGSAEIQEAPTNNIAIGFNSLSSDDNYGSNNVFLGAYTGNGFTSADSSYNTIVGSTFSRNNASYNTIIGYGAYTSGTPSDENKQSIKAMTAIGYGACNSVYGSNDGSRICIGYNSAGTTNNTPESFSTDSGEHIFIGGRPNPINTSSEIHSFAGRSILEIHNNTVNGNTVGNVVINSNLVVRGNFFPSNDSGGVVYNEFKNTQEIGAEIPYYRCNSDSYEDILSYYARVCKGLTLSNPKSINVLYYRGNCSTSGGYPSGGNCPNIVSSDIRLKTDISENNDGIDKISALKVYNYTFKTEPDINRTGVIAQELQKIFPDAVSKDENGYLKIRMEDMFYALVNSVKQLAQKIENIASKIADINKDIVTVRKEQKSIEKQISALNKRIMKLERN